MKSWWHETIGYIQVTTSGLKEPEHGTDGENRAANWMYHFEAMGSF